MEETWTQHDLDKLKEYFKSSTGQLRGLDVYQGESLIAEIERLRALAADHAEFINWIVQEIDDYDQLCRIVKRAIDNPEDMNRDCQRSIELFLNYVGDDAVCDHETGICNCKLRRLLGVEE